MQIALGSKGTGGNFDFERLPDVSTRPHPATRVPGSTPRMRRGRGACIRERY
jgi:hypothetical protein